MNMSLDARNEYLANKKKNNSSFNNILSEEPIIPPQDKFSSYSPFTISNYDKAQKQKQYKEYLDSQMNAKKLYKDTYYNLEKGQPTIQQRLNKTAVTPQTNDVNPNMMMNIMVVMIAIMSINFSVALSLYWIASTCFTIAQNLLVKYIKNKKSKNS